MVRMCTARFAAGWMGNALVVAFLVVQALDGACTYLGVRMWGPGVEGNPLIVWALAATGPGPALVAAKSVAMGFGILLHRRGVHRVVAALTLLYLVAAVVPWTTLLMRTL